MRSAEIRWAVGAREIDIVIFREQVLTQNWSALYDEVAPCARPVAMPISKPFWQRAVLKTLRNVYKAHEKEQAGADFIKTSTGKEEVNATLPVSLTMVRALRDYGELTGHKVGFKPAGGLRTAKDAMNWLILMGECHEPV